MEGTTSKHKGDTKIKDCDIKWTSCRIKHVLSERIANKITETINSSDIETITTWAFQYLNSLDWDKDLDKIKDRRKTQEKIIKDGIKKFAI